jgi:hypothetical protein
MGWQIFTHSVRLVWANLGVALRISALLYIISAAFQVWAQVSGFGTMEDGVPNTEGAGIQFIGTIVSVITSLWIAVAWHRYILLEEEPDGFLPNWNGGRMAAYFGRSILIGLAMVAVVLVASLPIAIGLQGPLAAAILSVGSIFAVFLFYRLCAILPSAAVGEPLTMSAAWKATEGTTGTIFVIILCMIGGLILLVLPGAILASISLMLGIIYMVAAQWFITMFGISLFTTFYGYFIEKRELS